MKKLLLTLIICLITTLSFADSIFFEGFEYANHDMTTPIGWTCDDESWLCGYLDKDHNRAPHSGNWYAFTNAEDSWMFMPLFFSYQLKYRPSFWAISDGTFEVEFWVGNEANASAMTTLLFSATVNSGNYEWFSEYINSLPSDFEYFGIHAIASEGAYHLTIDDVNIDMVNRYEFTANPSSASTSLYPGEQVTFRFDVTNLGYEPIDVIFFPSYEYFTDIHFTVEGNLCTTFHLEPDETKQVITEATLLPSITPGTTCFLDILLDLDCSCATAMTTLWVTVMDPTEVAEDKTETMLFPNPVANQLNIHENGLQRVEIKDVKGKSVITATADRDNLQLDLSRLTAGLYFVTTISERGAATTKIVKQ